MKAKTLRFTLPLLLCAAFPAAAMDGPAPAQVSACFTPGAESCAAAIASAIDGAQRTVLVQAYRLTSAPILHALAAAKRRGVSVAVILGPDAEQPEHARPRRRVSRSRGRDGVVRCERKVIVDGRLVITGSFNFTKAADTANVENMVEIDSPEVARWFVASWEARRAVSRVFMEE
jgi:phospholipase D